MVTTGLVDTVLQVEGLTVQRGTYAAVQQVTFSLQAGTDTALVGPNGAGKSTLVKALLGILPSQSGHVTVLGHPLDRTGHLPLTARRQIAYLPQSASFDRALPMTVAELVGLGWSRPGWQLPWSGHRQRYAAIQEALARVNAAHLIQRPLKVLSGGEIKRVLLAYCLVQPRRLLILDEAPAGLDYRSETEFYQLLNQLKLEYGWAILQVSHNLEMVSRYCNQVICMNQRIVCRGTPAVALSDRNLLAAYGSEMTRYRHSHEG